MLFQQTFCCDFIEAQAAAQTICNLLILDGKTYGLEFLFFGITARNKHPHSVFFPEGLGAN